MSEVIHCLQQNGFYMLRKAISSSEIVALIQSTKNLACGSPHGVRNSLKKSRIINDFLQSKRIRNIVEPIAGKSAFPVRTTYFGKVPDANWNVAWHQDTKIAAKKKMSCKDMISGLLKKVLFT